MASVSDICNMALSHIGSAADIISISPPDTNSAEAGHCARFYPIARKEALESHKWTWSKKRVALATVTNPSTIWAYAYALPSDCLRPMRVLQQSLVDYFDLWPQPDELMTADNLVLWSERGSADFEIEGGVLLTHEPDAVLLYTRDVTDAAKFSGAFTTFLSYLLASYLAGPILKGNTGAQAAGKFREIAAQVRGEAAANDANSSAERNEHMPSHILGRR
jgi:hypothetical protein